MRFRTMLSLVGAATALSCGVDGATSSSSGDLALSANRATGGEAVSYEVRAGTPAAPRVAFAENGDRIEIVVNRPSTFTLHSKSVDASGTFRHLDAAGNVVGQGTWIATKLLSFQSYGPSPILPPAVEAGKSLMEVELSPAAGGGPIGAKLTVGCVLPGGEDDDPGGAFEGVRLAVHDGPNFNREVFGGTVFIRL